MEIVNALQNVNNILLIATLGRIYMIVIVEFIQAS